MVKIRVPNARGHYEMNGFEIDVDDRDIIIRTSNAAENKDRYQREKRPPEKRGDDPRIGPVTGGILRKFGLLE
jgi:hypothetical protein